MKELTLKEEVRKFALECYVMTEHSDAVLDKIVDIVIQSIREKLPEEVGYIEHMARKKSHDEGNGWNAYRTQILTMLDTLTSSDTSV